MRSAWKLKNNWKKPRTENKGRGIWVKCGHIVLCCYCQKTHTTICQTNCNTAAKKQFESSWNTAGRSTSQNLFNVQICIIQKASVFFSTQVTDQKILLSHFQSFKPGLKQFFYQPREAWSGGLKTVYLVCKVFPHLVTVK